MKGWLELAAYSEDAILAMHHLFFYAALLVSSRSSFAFHSIHLPQTSQRNGYYYNFQRRTSAQPLILETFDCSYDITVIPQICRTRVPYILPDDFRTCTSSSESDVHATVMKSNDLDYETISPSIIVSKKTQQSSIEGGDLVCRLIARSDRKLPSIIDDSGDTIVNGTRRNRQRNHYSKILHQIDDIYHAKAHQQFRHLLKQYLPKPKSSCIQDDDDTLILREKSTRPNKDKENRIDDDQDGQPMVASALRQSLEDAGYELLSRRDLDLCEALNAGYLLRLSILPDTSSLDPNIVYDMYPEKFHPMTRQLLPEFNRSDDFLFDQRVLVYWRGYSKEVTRGRLLLPKLDYLQASIVQRLFGNVRSLLGQFERSLSISSLSVYRQATACFLYYLRSASEQIPNKRISKSMRKMIRSPYFYSAYKVLNHGQRIPSVKEMKNAMLGENSVFTLSRYGGTKTKFVSSPNPRDALNPFIICEENNDIQENVFCSEQIEEFSANSDIDKNTNAAQSEDQSRVQLVNLRMYESLNRNEIRCPYDKSTLPQSTSNATANDQPMQLLERVSISNLVDIFTKDGRRSLLKTMLTKSELVEPTYEEVVVIWRPLKVDPQKAKPKMPKFVPPKILYEIADMFDMEGALPPQPQVVVKEAAESATTSQATTTIPPIEIRTFEGVPMANLPAVLPKTKLIFRPADAFVFDLISVLSFAAIIGSIRFDNPRLDFIAIVSVGLWLIRTVLRYSNKLARYDLLVKTFLTSKITYRNGGALRYVLNEAGLQRAKRATLVYMWLNENFNNKNNKNVQRSGLFGENLLLRSQLVQNGQHDVQRMMNTMKRTPVDMDAALNDLEELQLVRRLDDAGQLLDFSDEETDVSQALQRTWLSLFTTSRVAKRKTKGNKSSQRQ